MTLDLDAIARKAGIVSGPADSYITQAELMRAEAFAALLLEKAAQVCDKRHDEWLEPAVKELAAEIRAMAAGMGE